MVRIIFFTLTVAAAAIALITQGFISYSNPLVAGVVDRYGATISNLVRVEVIHPGTVRSEILSPQHMEQLANGNWIGLSWRELQDYEKEPGELTVVAVTPDASQYSQIVSNCLEKEVEVVVESSGMDAWHSSVAGQAGLKKLTSKALRVVVFDGGHHLPTLGLQPDLLIVPVTMGYIAHGHMQDAMRIENLLKILRREEIDCPVVAFPRWGMVKTPASMNRIAVKALTQLNLGNSVPRHEGRVLGPHLTMYGQVSFLYVNHRQGPEWDWLEPSSHHHIKRVYVAFDYDAVNQEQAGEILEKLKQDGLQAELTNEPLHVAGVIIRGGMRCISARMPWY
ncbi:MAG: hypothetical protein ACM3UW_06420 [Bacillota bacterium]